MTQPARSDDPAAPAFLYEDAVALLTARGLDEYGIRLGSITESSLAFAGEAIARHSPRRPLRALHVGNFLGVSLTALCDIVVRHDPDSVVVSVDPNLRHLGIADPQRHVLALLDHFGLLRNNVVISGYTLGRAANVTKVSKGGRAADGEYLESAGEAAAEPASEHTLESLERLGQRFDVALIDGNHDHDYLRRELDVLVRLLSEGALLMLDDVSLEHAHLRDLFEEVAADRSWPLEKLAADWRLGILRRTAGATE